MSFELCDQLRDVLWYAMGRIDSPGDLVRGYSTESVNKLRGASAVTLLSSRSSRVQVERAGSLDNMLDRGSCNYAGTMHSCVGEIPWKLTCMPPELSANGFIVSLLGIHSCHFASAVDCHMQSAATDAS